jgi:hypothetical protein
MRWRPETGLLMTIGGFAPDCRQEDREHAWQALQVSYGRSRRGPPRKNPEDDRVMIDIIFDLVCKYVRVHQALPSQRYIAQALLPRLRPGSSDIDSRSMETHIARLRKKSGYATWKDFARAAQPP